MSGQLVSRREVVSCAGMQPARGAARRVFSGEGVTVTPGGAVDTVRGEAREMGRGHQGADAWGVNVARWIGRSERGAEATAGRQKGHGGRVVSKRGQVWGDACGKRDGGGDAKWMRARGGETDQEGRQGSQQRGMGVPTWRRARSEGAVTRRDGGRDTTRLRRLRGGGSGRRRGGGAPCPTFHASAAAATPAGEAAGPWASASRMRTTPPRSTGSRTQTLRRRCCPWARGSSACAPDAVWNAREYGRARTDGCTPLPVDGSRWTEWANKTARRPEGGGGGSAAADSDELVHGLLGAAGGHGLPVDGDGAHALVELLGPGAALGSVAGARDLEVGEAEQEDEEQREEGGGGLLAGRQAMGGEAGDGGGGSGSFKPGAAARSRIEAPPEKARLTESIPPARHRVPGKAGYWAIGRERLYKIPIHFIERPILEQEEWPERRFRAPGGGRKQEVIGIKHPETNAQLFFAVQVLELQGAM
ncbi:hypothetical protein B0H14DRAFT_3144922 [Mycena olivaceomarginata]|nr:hypothetical protein B0H14DRAFT_3144922 [Mycena olivaceomarginata]